MPDSMPVTLAVGGDVSLANCVADNIRRHGARWVFELIAPRVAGADLMTFNWESPVLPRGQDPPEKGLVVPDELVVGVADGLPPLAVTVANNHAFDAGVEGVAATRKKLDELGVAHFGAGDTEAEADALRLVEVNGLRIGFLGRAEDCPQLADKGYPGPAMIRYPQVVEDVRAAARQCDCVVVHLHHGVEFVDWPGPHFVRLCRELIDAGARLVVGGHPHVPQGHETCGAGHIFYCLGNLAFEITNDGYQGKGSPWTRRSAVALVPVGPGGAGEPTLVPYQIDDGRPAPLEGADAAAVTDRIAAVSADLGDGAAMQRHWRETALRYLGIYLDWALGTCDEDGRATEETVQGFFPRLAMNESRMWVRELFGDAEWPRKISRPPWT